MAASVLARPRIKFPHIRVQLIGEDGNAFAILGRVTRALRVGGASDKDVASYMREATSGDYRHVLVTTFRWVEVL
jgi:hypothetical protein